MKRIVLPQAIVSVLLSGATQVSVPVRPQPELLYGTWHWEASEFRSFYISGDEPGHEGHHYYGRTVLEEVADALLGFCPFPIGAVVWVPETWAPANDNADSIAYKADGLSAAPSLLMYDGTEVACYWKPAITMPEWAARLRYEVEGVKAGMAHELDYDSALAEGYDRNFQIAAPDCADPTCKGIHYGPTWHRVSVWDSIWPAYPWDSNPWTLTYTLRRT